MKTIQIKFKHYKYFGKPMTAPIFFGELPYVTDRYKFVDSNNPQFVISNKHVPPGKYTRIYYNCENVRVNPRASEWSFGVDYEDRIRDRTYMRQPNYVRLGAGNDLLDVKTNMDVEAVLRRKTKFCAFIYAHQIPLRNKFFELLSKYKKVDAPGQCCNNMSPIGRYTKPIKSRRSKSFCDEKISFLHDYKFVIAFEHSSYPGYVSEKIYHPYLSHCIPIYWGNPRIEQDFNVDSMITAHGMGIKDTNAMFEYMIEKVIALDNDPDLYAKYIQRTPYPNGKLPKWVDPTRILARFIEIFGK